MSKKKANLLVRAWRFVDGHKTNFGAFVGFVYLSLVANDVVTYDQTVVQVIDAVFGIGLAHKLIKVVKS